MVNTNSSQTMTPSKPVFKELLVVDDQLIREKYFAEANDILKKIESLEIKIKSFHSSDQRQYDQWYKTTFRNDQEAIDQIQMELKDLARFHNWVIAVSHQLDIELHEAYALVKDEEQRFANADVDLKKQIEKDRQERDAFIESEIHSKYSGQYEGDEEEEKPDSDPLDQILTRLEDLVLPEDHEALSEPNLRMERLMALDDDEIESVLHDQEIAFLFFDVGLTWGETEGDFAFFMRVWSLLSDEQKSTFTEVYDALTGRSIEDLVHREKKRARHEDESSDEDFESEFAFERESQFRKPNRAQRRARPSAQDEEKIKSLYRKLIRKLHPDVQGELSASHTGWNRRAWELVQKAYTSGDVKALERLFKLTLLRTHSLDQLTIDEIKEARTWLKKDLDQVEREASFLKVSPAWGFSSRKNLAPLIQKMKRQFQQTLYSVRSQIEELRDQHSFFESLLMMEEEAKRYRSHASRPRSRNSKMGGPRRSQSRRRSSKRVDSHGEDEDKQESFF